MGRFFGKINKHKMIVKNWYSLSISKVFSETKSSKNGLTSFDADKRLKDFGRNVLLGGKKKSEPMLFISQFNSLLMYILLVTVAIPFFLKYYTDNHKFVNKKINIESGSL